MSGSCHLDRALNDEFSVEYLFWFFQPTQKSVSKFNKQVGSNNSGEDGKNIICVGEKTNRQEIFLNIDKQRGGSNNSR